MQAANDPIAPSRGIPRAEIKVSAEIEVLSFLYWSNTMSVYYTLQLYRHVYGTKFIYLENIFSVPLSFRC